MKIKTLLFLISSIFLLNSCKKNEEVINLNNTQNIKPLFLDFYPNMEDKEFYLLLNKYDSLGVLENQKFNIDVDNDIFDFSISNNYDNIELSYQKLIANKTNENYFDNFTSHSEKVKLKSMVKKIYNFLEKKYSKDENILNNKHLKTKVAIARNNPYYYLFNKNISSNNFDSFIFRDQEKTIVLTYEIFANQHYSIPWFSELDRILNDKISRKTFKIKVTNNLNQIENDIDITNNDSLLYEEHLSKFLFSLNINIKYYNNDVFDGILSNILSEKKIMEKNSNLKKVEQEKLNQKQKNNLNKL
ncbi:hypothetical protein [Flavobacterium macrobrachii]|uniref:hypothetical protein n=1 Tax=Flavobacterium macrobrachii TaxID=591204 RepID=UPI003F6F7362